MKYKKNISNAIIKNWVVILFLLFICILVYLVFLKSGPNIVFYNFDGGWDDPYERKRLLDLFEILLKNWSAKFKEIRLYSIFGELKPFNKEDGVLTVQLSGENYYNDPSLFDLNFIPGDESQRNVITMSYMAITMFSNKADLSIFTRRRKLLDKHSKFCLFAVSNPLNKKRNNFFKALNTYKHVDSCGKVMNNLGHKCPGNHFSTEFHKFISKYKFMICFENESKKDYLTEKLYNAYQCGTIPIYWGCPNIGDYINMSAILYLKHDYTEDDLNSLIEEIVLLDSDTTLYKQKYESVFFKDGLIPDKLNISRIKDKVDVFFRNEGY